MEKKEYKKPFKATKGTPRQYLFMPLEEELEIREAFKKAQAYDKLMSVDIKEALKILDQIDQDVKGLNYVNYQLVVENLNNISDFIKSQEAKIRELEEKVLNEIVNRLYPEMEYMDYKVIKEQPKLNERAKQGVDISHELFENCEYVYQTTGILGDDFYGTIYRKFKDKEEWLVVTYEC